MWMEPYKRIISLPNFYMKKCILFCLTFLLFSFAVPRHVLGSENPLPTVTKISDVSAYLTDDTLVESPSTDTIRVLKLRRYFTKWNSPLASFSDLIVYAANAYEIPWTLIPAIAGVESGFCRSIIHNSYNCWGWRNGVHRFVSYEEAIITISQSLRLKYYDKGLTTIERIAPRYAPPSPNWGGKVRFFMEKIEGEFPLDSLHLQISI